MMSHRKQQLIDIINSVKYEAFANQGGARDISVKDQIPEHAVEYLADALLASGHVTLPCEVGTSVWVVSMYYTSSWEVYEGYVESFTVYGHNTFMSISARGNFNFGLNTEAVGRFVFFSEEEAVSECNRLRKLCE